MKGTTTEKNVLKAFAGESQARSRYLFYAKIASKEGYEEIAELFTQTADHELSHSKNFFKYLEDAADIEITAKFPGGRLGTTLENLQQAIANELEEGYKVYLKYSEEAKEEGFMKVAALFKNIALVEQNHGRRFEAIYKRLSEGKWFERDVSVQWMCRKCGYIHEGTTPPEICPACHHPKGYFECYELTY